jgi:hypothetical protein
MKTNLILVSIIFSLFLFGCTTLGAFNTTDTINGIHFSNIQYEIVSTQASNDPSQPPQDIVRMTFTIENVGKEQSKECFGYKLEVKEGYIYPGYTSSQNGNVITTKTTTKSQNVLGVCTSIPQPFGLIQQGKKNIEIYFKINNGTTPAYLIVEDGGKELTENDAKVMLVGGDVDVTTYGKVPIIYNEQLSRLTQTSCYTPECFEVNSKCNVGELTIPEKVPIYSDFESIPNQTKVQVTVFDNAPKNCVITYYDLVSSKYPNNPKINLLCQKPEGETSYQCGQVLLSN